MIFREKPKNVKAFRLGDPIKIADFPKWYFDNELPLLRVRDEQFFFDLEPAKPGDWFVYRPMINSFKIISDEEFNETYSFVSCED